MVGPSPRTRANPRSVVPVFVAQPTTTLWFLVTASSNGRTPIYPPDSPWPTHLTSPFPSTPAEKKTAVLFLWPSSGPFHTCPTCAQGNAITRTHHRPQHVCTETPVSGEERKRRIQEQIYGFVSCATLFSLRLIICTAPGSTWNQ